MTDHTRAHANAGRFVISADGTVLGPRGTVFLAADDPRNPGNLILDSLGNVVDPASGSVVASVEGFEASVTVTRPPPQNPSTSLYPQRNRVTAANNLRVSRLKWRCGVLWRSRRCQASRYM